MNSYYHAIALSFNWWMLAIVAFVAVAVVVGKLQWKVKKGKVVERYGDGIYALLGVAAAVTLGILLVKESSTGIVQFLDNIFGAAEQPFWSAIMMLPAAAVAAIIFGVIIVVIGVAASYNRREVLVDRLEQRRRQQRHQMAAQRSAYPRRTRRQEPKGCPRPGTARPRKYHDDYRRVR